MIHAAWSLARLKWALLRAAVKGSAQQRIQIGLSLILCVVFGLSAFGVLSTLGQRSASADQILIVLLPATVIAIGLLSSAAGVESTIDARHLAAEPLTRSQLGTGLLVSAVVGPPTLLALLAGAGIAIGWSGSSPSGLLILFLAILGWLLTLLLFSRTMANAVGAWSSGRFRQVAQALATISALSVWFIVQVLTRQQASWTAERWTELAEIAKWTPPGQLGLAGTSSAEPAQAVVHLLLGLSWLPLLLWLNMISTERLALSSPRPGSGGRKMRTGFQGLRSGVYAALPHGAVGAIAARTIRTKFRTPRQAVNTITALAIGAGIFVVGPLLDGEIGDPRTVMLGGLLFFAVLFDGNNSFGVDGPALWMEIQAGADARVLARAKALSSIVVMAVPALVLPVGLAIMSGGWKWLPAAWILAVGSLMGAAGVSVGSAALAPVAVPDSPNPLAAGDTGQGCLAGLMLSLGLLVLVLASAPVAGAVLYASSRSALLTTIAALLGPVVGLCLLWGGTATAVTRLSGRESDLVGHITPAR